MSKTIKHIWFDFSETIVFLRKERHNRLRYESYAEVVGKPVNDDLINEYEDLYRKNNKSNAAIFRSLGQSSNYWSDRINFLDPKELYRLADDSIPSILCEIREIVPISIFSNIELDRILIAFQIKQDWFTHIISAGMVKEPKPALEGFRKMVELSDLPPQNILYIGDDVGKDVRPAKQIGIQTGLVWSKSDEADYSFEDFKQIYKFTRNQVTD